MSSQPRSAIHPVGSRRRNVGAARIVLAAAQVLGASTLGATELDLVIPAGLSGGDEAAYALAMDGQRVAVGLPGAGNGSGAVVVLNCQVTPCVQEQRLALTPARPGAALGFSVALAGDVLVAGLPDHDAGAVQIFRRDGGGVWSLERELAPVSGAAGDRFGLAVSLAAGRIAVASPRSAGGSGRVDLYVEAGGAWTREQVLPAPSGGGRFGQSLALNGSSLLVGAPFLAPAKPGSFARGSVFVYVQSGGAWVAQAGLRPAAIADGDLFGYSVALDGDLAVIGAPRRATGRGSGFVYQRSGTTWTEQAELIASRGRAGDNLGWSAAVQGTRVGLGAPFASEDPGGGCGRLQLFDGPGPWQENALGNVARPQAGELDGWAVAASAGRWLAGTPGRAVGALSHHGAFYRFDPDLRLFADGLDAPLSPCAP